MITDIKTYRQMWHKHICSLTLQSKYVKSASHFLCNDTRQGIDLKLKLLVWFPEQVELDIFTLTSKPGEWQDLTHKGQVRDRSDLTISFKCKCAALCTFNSEAAFHRNSNFSHSMDIHLEKKRKNTYKLTWNKSCGFWVTVFTCSPIILLLLHQRMKCIKCIKSLKKNV